MFLKVNIYKTFWTLVYKHFNTIQISCIVFHFDCSLDSLRNFIYRKKNQVFRNAVIPWLIFVTDDFSFRQFFTAKRYLSIFVGCLGFRRCFEFRNDMISINFP